METRYCKTCNKEKCASEFYPKSITKCKECCRAAQRKYFSNPDNLEKKRNRGYLSSLRPEAKKRAKDLMAEMKKNVMSHYGDRCSCCGEDQIEFLTLDHINGDGAKHRRDIGLDRRSGGGPSFYRWVIKNNYPGFLQILCYNCNCAKRTGKMCPHKKGINHE